MSKTQITAILEQASKLCKTTDSSTNAILKLLHSATKPVSSIDDVYSCFISLASNHEVQRKLFSSSSITCRNIIENIMKNLKLCITQQLIYKISSSSFNGKSYGVLLSSTSCSLVIKRLKAPLEKDINTTILDNNLIIRFDLTDKESAYICYDPINSLVGLGYFKG